MEANNEILNFLRYNLWANLRIMEVLRGLTQEQWEREVTSSFNSISKTVLHIWDAEQVWHTRLQKKEITTWPSKDFKGNYDELLEGWEQSSKALISHYLHHLKNSNEKILHYKNLRGETQTRGIEQVIVHISNHGSYHRGQLVTLLRHVGITDLPGLDIIFFEDWGN